MQQAKDPLGQLDSMRWICKCSLGPPVTSKLAVSISWILISLVYDKTTFHISVPNISTCLQPHYRLKELHEEQVYETVCSQINKKSVVSGK